MKVDIRKKMRFPAFFFLIQHDNVYRFSISFSCFYFFSYTLSRLFDIGYTLYNLRRVYATYQTTTQYEKNEIELCSIGIRSGTKRSNNRRKKIERICKKKKKKPRIRHVVHSSFLDSFFSFLLLLLPPTITHRYSLIERAVLCSHTACEDEKVVIFFCLFSLLHIHTQTRARVHTYTFG